MYTLSGVSAGAGVGAAPSLTISKTKNTNSTEEIFAYDVETEIDRFNKKSSRFSQKLLQIVNPAKDSVRDLIGATAGFITSSDNKLEILELIKRGCSASMAARTVLFENLDNFFKKENDLKTDKSEIQSLLNEFIHTLEHSKADEIELPELKEDVVLIAKTISPAQLLSLDTKFVKGVVLEEGRDSSHLGVVLRELNIPAVFGVFDATNIKSGTYVIVDSNAAVVIVEPPEDMTQGILRRQESQLFQINDESLLNITLGAAVGAISQNDDVEKITAHGLGLLRSEFLFLSSMTEPTEEEMTQRFNLIFSKVKKNAPLTSRTFDFADDKKPLFTVITDDEGPLKGYGACVGTALLKKEIRAMLRASVGQEITIVFPLITKISEKDYLFKLANDCQAELEAQKIHHGKMLISFMVETPAAVLLAPAFATNSAMMLLGTSSLAEYASAPCPADSAFTPVLAKMIAMAAKAAHEAGVTLGVAGRFASRTELLPFFYKMGVSYLVTGTYNIQKVKGVVERLNLEHDIQPCFDIELYNKIITCYTGSELSDILNSFSC
ncbi:putative PEP-binding protein [uncultured Succinivibrio sp.]|uniref:putative PEP-binding protein n=1 Tax=uncultured Succinivibrio sp. TaxID=540749 RepID=UPI0025E38CB9|nr:putative PEP-binding protein [uncultured Succinivibrio sp.]